MENIEFSIIIEFRYGIEDDGPFYELSEKLFDRMESDQAPGKYDGHEMSMDNFDARLYFYSFQPQKTLAFVDDILKNYKFLYGGRIFIRDSKIPDGYTDVEMIDTNGDRQPLSRFDSEKLSTIPKWGVWDREMDEDEKGEEWKGKNERAEKLFNKWREIDFLIEAIWDKWDLSSSKTKGTENGKIILKQGKTEEEVQKELDEMEDFGFPGGMIDWHRDEMRSNSLIIPSKISGAEAGNLYIIRMENASIIRTAANSVYLDCHFLSEAKVADKHDIELLRDEIKIFRELFKEWVQGFEPDEFEDEWGLFTTRG